MVRAFSMPRSLVSAPTVCCALFVFASSLALLYINARCSCHGNLDSPEPTLPKEEEAALVIKQTPSVECNRALTRLVSRNRSSISSDRDDGALGLSRQCVHLLLDRQLTFASQRRRQQLLSASPGRWNRSHCFRRAMLEVEKSEIRRRLGLVKDAFDAAGVPLILDGGTLIGSYRHHGFVPWDDDFDFRISWAHSDVASAIFTDLAKRHPTMFRFKPVGLSDHWKFYILDLRLQKAEVPNFLLCLDIFFYHDPEPGSREFNLTDRWVLTPRQLYFPLTARPFEGFWFHAPADPLGFLSMYYGDISRKCYYKTYSNLASQRDCRNHNRNLVPCSTLHHIYPFVRRVYLGNSGASVEFLVLEGHLIQTIFFAGKAT